MAEALTYITLPGEVHPLNQLTLSTSKVQTSKRDVEISQDLNITIKHPGWLWTQDDKIAIFHNPIYYHPQVDDQVIVAITGKNSECYYCNLGNGLTYNLSVLDFEGATKKNRPNYQTGDILYCRVSEVNHYLKGKLTCINPKSKKEWTTGEALFRQLQGGLVIDVSNAFADQLSRNTQLFKEIGQKTTYEVCVGKNGRIWIKGEKAILISLILKKAQHLSSQEQLSLVQYFNDQF